MSRDRLAALRAQQGQRQQQQAGGGQAGLGERESQPGGYANASSTNRARMAYAQEQQQQGGGGYGRATGPGYGGGGGQGGGYGASSAADQYAYPDQAQGQGLGPVRGSGVPARSSAGQTSYQQSQSQTTMPEPVYAGAGAGAGGRAGQGPAAAVNGSGYGDGAAGPAPDDMNAFFGEISDLQDALKGFNSNVGRIGDLHSRTLNEVDDAQSQRNHAQLESIVQQTSSMTNGIKNRIKRLESANSRIPDSSPNKKIRQTQVANIKQRFMTSIQSYQNVEKEYRQRYRQRMERQYKIVKPDATQQEVEAAMESDQGAQVFSQALLNSNRFGEARSAYREVQERHQDIQRIERTITELAELFNQMAILVETQDETIGAIETHANNVQKDTEAGLTLTERAVKSARGARKKRIICAVILVIIVIILALVLGIHFGTK